MPHTPNGHNKSTMDLLRVILSTMVDKNDVALPTVISLFTYINIKGPGSTLVKNGISILHVVNINFLSGGNSTVKLYNALSAVPAKLIGTINSNAAIGSFIYDLELGTGIFVVITGSASVDITVVYA